MVLRDLAVAVREPRPLDDDANMALGSIRGVSERRGFRHVTLRRGHGGATQRRAAVAADWAKGVSVHMRPAMISLR